jgi:hypothetical protein
VSGPTLDDVKRRFEQEVQTRAADDRYIDRAEELAILQFAIQNNVAAESARAALAQVCESNGCILESAALRQAREVMAQFAADDGRIGEKEFSDVVGLVRRATQGMRDDTQLKRLVLQIMRDEAYRPRTGLLSNWHARVKTEVGMT